MESKDYVHKQHSTMSRASRSYEYSNPYSNYRALEIPFPFVQAHARSYPLVCNLKVSALVLCVRRVHQVHPSAVVSSPPSQQARQTHIPPQYRSTALAMPAPGPSNFIVLTAADFYLELSKFMASAKTTCCDIALVAAGRTPQ